MLRRAVDRWWIAGCVLACVAVVLAGFVLLDQRRGTEQTMSTLSLLAPCVILVVGLGLAIGVTLILRAAAVSCRAVAEHVAERVEVERAQQRVLASERRALAEAQAIAHVGSFSVDPATEEIEWSDEMFEIFNRPKAAGAATTEWFTAHLLASDEPRVAADYADAVAGGGAFDLVGRVRLDDGRVRVLHMRGRPDALRGYAGTVQDITEQTELREQLAAAGARLQAVLEHAPMGIYLRSPDGVFTVANQEIAALLDRKVPEVIGRSVAELLPTDAAARELESDEMIVATGVSPRETRGALNHADDRSFLWQKFPVRDTDGAITGVGGIAIDITERVLTEQALRDTEERFRQAFEGSPVGMAIIDFDGCVQRINESLCAIIGRPRDRLEGAPARWLAISADSVAGARVLDEMQRGERTTYDTDLQLRNAAGDIVDCSVRTAALPGADGVPRAVLTQVQDITERQEHQRQLEYLADHDAMTDLLNRRAFMRALDAHHERVEHNGATGSVLLIDLDGFKQINDVRGHHAGDELIKRVAELLRGSLRSSDVIARLGGDEFIVLLPEMDQSTADETASRLRAKLLVGTTEPGSGHTGIRASIGVASWEAGQSGGVDDILIRADQAMYEQKRMIQLSVAAPASL